VPADLEQAKKWNDLATQCRTATNCFPSAALTDGPSTTAIDQVFTDNPDLRREAERGDPVAQFRLGERHYNERRRDPAKDMEALKWFRLSAAQGNADAELRLGYIYYWGRGEAQNYVEAASWYRRAADHGNVHGMTRLASMYRDGKGVPRDREEERKWDNRANEIATRPARQREYKWLAGIMLGVVALASALILLQRARLSGGKRIVVAAFVHVAGIALVLNSLVTYGLPELLFPKCSYGYLAASCSEYQDLGVRHIAEALRNWQTVNLVFRFMALFGFVFDALAVWYVAYLAQPLFRRRQ
jgi:TPR repeat protein